MGLAIAGLCSAALLVLAPPASAGKFVDSVIGGPGSGATGGVFNSPQDIAVSTAPGHVGEVYVVEGNNQRVSRFDAAGTFQRAFGVNVVSAGPGNASEFQQVYLAATAGTFTLSYGVGAPTATDPIDWDATAGEIEDALEDLGDIGAGDVLVSGKVGGPFTVRFAGALAGADRDQIAADGALLTGTVTTSTLVPGGAANFEICTAGVDTCRAGVSSATPNGADTGKNGAMNAPQGISIDEDTGNVYVADRSNLRVNVYDADGIFIRSFGHDVVTSGPGNQTVNQNEQQTVALSGGVTCCPLVFLPVTDGTFTLTFDPDGAGGSPAETTGAIPYDATDAVVEQHLVDDLPSIASGDVDVTGGPGPGTSWVVEFTGAYAGADVAQMTGSGASLVPPIATVGVTTTTPGGPAPAYEVCNASDGDRCKIGTNGSGPGQFGTTTQSRRLVVTPGDGNPASGRIYAADPQNRRVNVYKMDGTVATPSSFGTSAEFGGNNPLHVAVDADGIVYAANNDFSDGQSIRRWDSAANGGAGGFLDPIDRSANTSALEVNPDNGHLFIANALQAATANVAEYDPAASLTTPVDTHIAVVGANPGVGVNLAGLGLSAGAARLYVSESFGGHRVFGADDDGAPPAATDLDPPTDVQAHTATLIGSVTPDGPAGIATSYKFQYSKNGVAWTDATAFASLGEGSSPMDVQAAVTGLEANTSYRVRLATRKAFGNPEAYSAEQVLVTDAVPPTVSILPATRRDTSAVLSGRLNPEGTATTYQFEYGPTTTYGAAVPIPATSAGSGGIEQLVQYELTGLAPETTYHYRLVATNAQGTSASDDAVFTTRPLAGATADDPCPNAAFRVGPGAELPDCRAYELVTPADKLVGPGLGSHANNQDHGGDAGVRIGLPAVNGERFTAGTSAGPVLTAGAAVMANDQVFSERISDSVGWRSKSAYNRPNHVDPFLNPPFLPSLDTSDNLETTLWMAIPSVSLFAEMADPLSGFPSIPNPMYLSDWAGKWDLVAPTAASQGNPGNNILLQTEVSGDGTAAAVTMASSKGIVGPGEPDQGDPALSQTAGRAAYYIDKPNGMSDTFAGRGATDSLGACSDGTLIPERDASGKIGAQACPAPPDERQNVTVNATAGTFTLTYSGTNGQAADPQTTAPIPFDAPASGPGSVQEALEGLSNLEPGQVTVSGGPAYTVDFARSLGNVRQLTSDASLLSGGSASATVATVSEYRDEALISPRGSALSANANSSATKRIVSHNGDRAFFMSPDPGACDTGTPCVGSGSGTGATTVAPPQLYVRSVDPDTGAAVTRWISRSEVPGQDSTLLSAAYFDGASADGDRVFFHTASPLTADDPNTGGTCTAPCTVGNPSATSWDLYMYDFTDDPGDDPGAGDLVRISRGPTGAADGNVARISPDTSTPLRFAADDGRRVYFTSAAPLAGVAGKPSGALDGPGGTTSTTSTVNLYLYDSTGPEAWTFVGLLPASSPNSSLSQGSDISQCATTAGFEGGLRMAWPGQAAPGGLFSVVGANCVRGSSDGRAISFWTQAKLTQDDPEGNTADIYLFDASANELVRISAPQGGSGAGYTCVTAGSVSCHADPGFQILSDVKLSEAPLGFATDPVIGGGPIAFFESRDKLVQEDDDDHMDVYSWQDGKLTLISTGVDDTSAYYAGNSADGRTAFIHTAAKLTWQDIDAVSDTYAARVGGGFPEPDPPAVCTILVDGCQGADAAPLPVQPKTPSSSGSRQGDNASPGVRKRLRVGNLSRKARRRAARRGVLLVRVRTSHAGLVRVFARARIGKRTRRVADRRVRLRKAGAVTVKLRLNRAAKRRLRSGRTLKLSLHVRAPGARTRTATVLLKKGGRR